ncbi:MAG: amino acid ABC transporter substrate-binding protein [Hyphomicrobiaceae bacterium]
MLAKTLRRWKQVGILAVSKILLACCVIPASPALAQEPIKIGFSMALTGGLAGGGKSALIAMQIWRDDINAKGGLLGRKVELVYYDDQTNPAQVPAIYTKLLDIDEVDLIVSGYGTNLIAPALPLVMQRDLMFPSLFGLGANEKFKYPCYFQIMPAGPKPKQDWSRNWFKVAMELEPKPKTIALVGADAEFARNAVDGARENAKELGLKIVYDQAYPPKTPDFTPIVRAIQARKPDIVYVGSYPPDSVGMVKAATEVGLDVNMFGGGMVGLQFATIQKALGEKLNGVVNYHFYVPEPTLKFPGVEEFLKKYQAKAANAGVDPLGYYLPPFAYAYLQVLEQSANAVGALDQGKMCEHARKSTFKTVVGDVKFAPNGEWDRPRALMIQFQGVKGNDLEQFTKPGTQVVLSPKELKSGDLRAPYSAARQ